MPGSRTSSAPAGPGTDRPHRPASPDGDARERAGAPPAQQRARDRGARARRGRLLDVGCGEKPYAPLFRDLVDERVGVDHPDSIHPLGAVDVLATAYDIPLEDGSFDRAEVWPLHEEPRDFFRYSPYGLRHPLQGFEPVTITPVAGKWSTLATFANAPCSGSRCGSTSCTSSRPSRDHVVVATKA